MDKIRRILNRDQVAGFVFIAPFIIGLIAFTVIPFFTSLYLAFTDYSILKAPNWIGLGNFQKMFFKDKLFWKSFGVTFKFALIQVPIKLLVSLLVAIILARPSKATSFYRAARKRSDCAALETAFCLQRSHQPVAWHHWIAFEYQMVGRSGYSTWCAYRPWRVAVRQFNAHFSGGNQKHTDQLSRSGDCRWRWSRQTFLQHHAANDYPDSVF